MENNILPRVLIISHNALNNKTNMGKTISSFFYSWRKEDIAQLYLYSELPNTEICNKFFRITDFDIIRSILKFGKAGCIVHEVENNNYSNSRESKLKQKIYNFGKAKKPYMYFVRNLIWATKKWDSHTLSKWIDDFNPDIVFFAAGDYTFSMNLAMNICKTKKLPLIVFYGDEYYFLKDNYNFSIFSYINRKKYSRVFKDIFRYLGGYITASDKMLEKYSGEFNKSGYAIMKSTEITKQFEARQKNQVKISYIGNLSLNRWKPLIEIGKILKTKKLLLDVYSSETRAIILSELTEENGIRFCGEISSNQVDKVIQSSTIIVHVESKDELYREKTMYSMSTKIAESLGSGICLFAYGPDDVSSIEYLVNNNAACVVTEKEELENQLFKILEEEELREKYIKNALNLAGRRHDFEQNSKIFQNMMKNISNEWKRRERYENTTG